MEYCENCHAVTAQEQCPVCGSRKLRAVTGDDYYFLCEVGTTDCDVLTGILTENDVPYTCMPCGNGIHAVFAMQSQIQRVYVPFSHYENVQALLRTVESDVTEQLRQDLLQHASALHVSPRVEKKIRKQCNIGEEDCIAYCLSLIRVAEKIADKGHITSCRQGGSYLFCYAPDAVLSVNSATYEILSVTIQKKA